MGYILDLYKIAELNGFAQLCLLLVILLLIRRRMSIHAG